ncbi:MAG: hypothetical protein JNM94_09875 [Phycisphaerae bacterium]|nr:hypothetical protein [Phycisphaerae bacterium]
MKTRTSSIVRHDAGRTWSFRATSLIAAAALLGAPSLALASNECAGDLTGDGHVDSIDLGILLGEWGAPATPSSSADLDQSGTVDASDLGAMLGGWGLCCPGETISYAGPLTFFADGLALAVDAHGTLHRSPDGADFVTTDGPILMAADGVAIGAVSMTDATLQVTVAEGRQSTTYEFLATPDDAVLLVDGAAASLDLAVDLARQEIGTPAATWSSSTCAIVSLMAIGQHGGWQCAMNGDGVAASASCLKKMKIASIAIAVIGLAACFTIYAACNAGAVSLTFGGALIPCWLLYQLCNAGIIGSSAAVYAKLKQMC